MAIVWIPSLMRDLTRGRAQISAPGRTVGQVLDALDQAYPGCRERLSTGGRLSPLISVLVDGRLSRLGLDEPVAEDSEIHFLPATGGG